MDNRRNSAILPFMTDIATSKAILRKQMLEKRLALPSAEKLAAAQSVKMHFADHPHLTYAKSFAGYYATRGELDVLPVFNHMAKFNKTMALPRTSESEMQFFRWKPGEKLEKGDYGIKVPLSNAEPLTPEVILVPLLAFDDRGYRLGYGGGYYDRYIHKLKQATELKPLFIGVGYGAQEVPALPIEEHDERLDGILTEQGVSLFSS